MTRLTALLVAAACCLSLAQTPRFTDNGDGSVTDRKTGLMWAKADNGSNISYEAVQPYLRAFRVAGHTDWRVPTKEELQGIFEPDACRPITCGGQRWAACVEAPIQLTCPWIWAKEDGGPTGGPIVHFSNGELLFAAFTSAENLRVLPVRTVK